MNWTELINERNVWVAHNFPGEDHDPSTTVLGALEEVGELAHSMLKSYQQIRGEVAAHHEAARDAIGDCTVYLLGAMNWAFYTPDETKWPVYVSSRDIFFQLGQEICGLGSAMEAGVPPQSPLIYRHIDRAVALLKEVCRFEGWNYELIVHTVWNKVKQRDWVADPTTGGDLDGPGPVQPPTSITEVEQWEEGD